MSTATRTGESGTSELGTGETGQSRLRNGAISRRGFERTSVWLFDLDNTLYPAECNLFAQVDQRMAEFIAKFLGVPFAYAKHLQKAYYRQFGTTLAGMDF